MTNESNALFVNTGKLSEEAPGINNVCHYISIKNTLAAAMTPEVENENRHPVTGDGPSTGFHSTTTRPETMTQNCARHQMPGIREQYLARESYLSTPKRDRP